MLAYHPLMLALQALVCTISVQSAVSWSASPTLASFTADFHSPDSKCKKHENRSEYCWANASILNVDLTHPILIQAAGLLSPAFWRIGGTPADSTLYQMGGFRCPKQGACSAAVEAACNVSSKDKDGCMECARKHGIDVLPTCTPKIIKNTCEDKPDDSSFYCLTEQRWLQVLDFADNAGLSIVFGLNYAGHLNLTNPVSKWDSSNARALLQLTAATEKAKGRQIVHGWELGNELNIGGDVSDPDAQGQREHNTTRYGAAFDELAALISSVYTAAGAVSLPDVIGPDVSWIHDPDEVWLDGVLISMKRAPAAVSVHHYPAGKVGGNDSLIRSPAFLQDTKTNLSTIAQHIRQTMRQYTQPVWWGEGAFDFHSGHEGVTNAYEDCLFSAVMYGTLPSVGVQVWARSTLFGGYYELLDHQQGFRPNPSFWVAKLWKLLSGEGATPVGKGGERSGSSLYVWDFASNADGRPWRLVVNLGPSATTVAPSATAGTEHAELWLLTSKDGLHSRNVYLNGSAEPLELGNRLKSIALEASSVTMPPYSIAFIASATVSVSI